MRVCDVDWTVTHSPDFTGVHTQLLVQQPAAEVVHQDGTAARACQTQESEFSAISRFCPTIFSSKGVAFGVKTPGLHPHLILSGFNSPSTHWEKAAEGWSPRVFATRTGPLDYTSGPHFLPDPAPATKAFGKQLGEENAPFCLFFSVSLLLKEIKNKQFLSIFLRFQSFYKYLWKTELKKGLKKIHKFVLLSVKNGPNIEFSDY